MSDETPIPWADNQNARLVLGRLLDGPKTTIELQTPPIVHVARQIWELRHWYDHVIETKRLHNGVASYTLRAAFRVQPVSPLRTGAPVAAAVSNDAATASRAPVFGDVAAIRLMRARR